MNDFLAPISADQLFADSAADIDAIKTAAGFSEAQFTHFFMPALKAYANAVQNLPLCQTAYAEHRGAWQFGMAVSVLSLHIAGTKMFFPTLGAEDRRLLERQCRFAAFVAALATGVAIQTQSTRVRDETGGQYHTLTAVIPLSQWIEKAKKPIFSWRVGETPFTACQCAAIAARFIPRGLFDAFDQRISLMVFDSIFPKAENSGIESTLAKVVRVATEKAFEIYTTRTKETYKSKETMTASVTPVSADAVKAAKALQETLNPTPTVDPLAPPAQGAKAPASPTAAPAATPAENSQAPAESDEVAKAKSLLAAAPPRLQEWFKALRRHERFAELREKLVITDQGIEIPIVTLGHFGISPSTVREDMTAAGMVVGRTENAKGVILTPALKPIFFGASE